MVRYPLIVEIIRIKFPRPFNYFTHVKLRNEIKPGRLERKIYTHGVIST